MKSTLRKKITNLFLEKNALDLFLLTLLVGVWAGIGTAEARDLQQASTTYMTIVKRIIQGVSTGGVITGAIIMQFPGAEEFGNSVMNKGFKGCVVGFGAPAFISLLQAVFGNIT